MTLGTVPQVFYGDLDLTAYPFAIVMDGGDDGSPSVVYDVLDSLLTDGQVMTVATRQNRTLTRTVMIEGPDMAALAAAEAALVAECTRPRNNLTLVFGDDTAPPTVFDTFPAQLTYSPDAARESSLIRIFTLSIPAYPHPKSATAVETTALPAAEDPSTPTVLVIDDGTSTTGWSSPSGGSVTTDGDRIIVSPTGVGGTAGELAESIDLTGLEFIAVDWGADTSSGASHTLNLYVQPSGGTLTRLAAVATGLPSPLAAPSGVDNWVRNWYRCPYGAIERIRAHVSGTPAALRTLYLSQITATDQALTSGTARQQTRTIAIEGSVSTEVSLAIEHAEDSLGTVLAYTRPDDDSAFTPALSTYYYSGASTVDASTVSGRPFDAGVVAQYRIPNALLPEGAYVLYGRLKAAAAGVYDVPILFLSGLEYGGVGRTASITLDVDDEWQVVPLAGSLNLPGVFAPSSSDFVTSLLLTTPAGVQLDEAWLFDTTRGQVTVVDCGTDAPSRGYEGSYNRLWIESPTLDRPVLTHLLGTAPDQADAIAAGPRVRAAGRHRFQPPAMTVFTVTTNALAADVSLTHFPRWHTHAAF